MAIDVLLTYPSDGIRLFTSMIPTGLASIGTVLRDHGFHVKIIDFNHYNRDFRVELKQLQPKVVGISGTTPTRKGSFLTAKIVKSVLPDVTVVYGGAHATFTAEETLNANPDIDYIISGEGEFSFLSLCNRIKYKQGVNISEIDGLSYRTCSGIKNNPQKRINDLSLLPIPDRTLLPYNYKVRMEFIGGDGDFILTSRGCPVACNFCAASRMFPGGVRLRPISQVANEVESIMQSRNITGLKLFDSTFTANRAHVVSFCNIIKEFKLKWECEIRADTVDFELLKIMHDAGCYYINIGMETSNSDLLKRIGKGISVKQVTDILGICKKVGILTKVFFTFGHIGQTYKQCLEDIDFINRNKIKIDFFAVTAGMRIYPGTRLEKSCKALGLLPENFSWSKPAHSLKNIMTGEGGDIPIVYQKDLGWFHFFKILIKLLARRAVCTPEFLLFMVRTNFISLFSILIKQCIFTWHRCRRAANHAIHYFSQSMHSKYLYKKD